LVDGKEVLDKMESVPTDESDRPLEEIKISEVEMSVDPYEDYKKDMEKKLNKKKEREAKKPPINTEKDTTTWFGTKLTSSSSAQDQPIQIGKYFKTKPSKKHELEEDGDDGDSSDNDKKNREKKKKMTADDTFDTLEYNHKKVKPKGYDFGDFSNW
jgi:peptidyl-prolyl cis-trans isomerase-like 2